MMAQGLTKSVFLIYLSQISISITIFWVRTCLGRFCSRVASFQIPPSVHPDFLVVHCHYCFSYKNISHNYKHKWNDEHYVESILEKHQSTRRKISDLETIRQLRHPILLHIAEGFHLLYFPLDESYERILNVYEWGIFFSFALFT